MTTLAITLCGVLTFVLGAEVEWHTWKSADATYSITAAFVELKSEPGQDDKLVILKTMDGRVLQVPASKLSTESRALAISLSKSGVDREPLSVAGTNKSPLNKEVSQLDIAHSWRGKGKLLASLSGKRGKLVDWDFRGQNPIVELHNGDRVTLPMADLTVAHQELARALKKEAQGRGDIRSDEDAQAAIKLEDSVEKVNKEILVEVQRWVNQQSQRRRRTYSQVASRIISLPHDYLTQPGGGYKELVFRLSNDGAEDLFLYTPIGKYSFAHDGKVYTAEQVWKSILAGE